MSCSNIIYKGIGLQWEMQSEILEETSTRGHDEPRSEDENPRRDPRHAQTEMIWSDLALNPDDRLRQRKLSTAVWIKKPIFTRDFALFKVHAGTWISDMLINTNQPKTN